ncbi:hypothetical protein [Parerythrobacter jejuensis]|uniref:Uncharacterized protein n=1 Tax=Parerythrobacter jejuensis TaxID=795812 RepID=A0A845AS24_9SPHN|nr:hypothetical protein [Parerythrobacter jejuensis]MXP32289.1 hypothetical protein [Parerythrobacter jejuensis]
MSRLDRQLIEDRALRNAARALVKADIARLKSDLDNRGVGARALDRAKDGAAEVFDKASSSADSNKGILALLIGAIILWFARNPILALFFDEEELADFDQPEEPASPDALDPETSGDEE